MRTEVIVRPARLPPQAAAGDRVLLALLAVYLATLLFEGPLRYAVSQSPLPSALYLRDAIPAGTLLFVFVRALWVDQRIDMAVAVPAALLLMHAALAAILGVTPFSIALGLKIFMLVCYGMVMGPLIATHLRPVMAVAAWMFWITVAGVALCLFFGRMPWEGVEYQSTFGPQTTTRLWWVAGGTPRLPGFMRTSSDAAMVIGICGALMMSQVRTAPRALLVATLGFAAIVFTTMKGMLIAFPLAAAWMWTSRHASVRHRGPPLLAVLAVVTFLVPMLVASIGPSIPATVFPDLLFSVWARFTQMWPEAFALFPQNPLAIAGAGLGSIGMPQWYGPNRDLFNSADSLAIYLTVNFGALGAVYYFCPLPAVASISHDEDPLLLRTCICVLVVTYAYGIAISMVEEAFFGIVLGMCMGIVFRRAAATPRPAWQRTPHAGAVP